jgi:2-oxoglutarate ferredoxin oxidoreductase subunit beta
MSYIAKPKVTHPGLKKNELELTVRDYEGVMSTLCAGCGHDSVTAAIVQAFFELNIPPHRAAKMSGIGCSSKTPTYFMKESHGVNSVHGRMPSVTTGANAANKDLTFIGISGDGDSLSIGLGQMCHAIRRNLNMLYVLENNGVYGLTKGQFSASADIGSCSKRGVPNTQAPIDPVLVALTLGATFVARSFSGDKKQLVPIIKAALTHRGFAMLDVISPCVTFNDHKGSTKSYIHTRDVAVQVTAADFVPPAEEITTEYDSGTTERVELHDGSTVDLHKIEEDYDPTDRDAVYAYVRKHQSEGRVVTGLLYLDGSSEDMHAANNTTATPLYQVPYQDLCPGSAVLDEINARYR